MARAQVLSPDEAAGCILVNRITGQPFPIVDSTVYQNRPNMNDFCISDVPLVYAQHLWASGHEEETLPDRNRITGRAESYNRDGVRIIIDLELWISEWRGYDVADYIGHYTTVHEWFKSAAPDVPVGFYDVIPKRHYWPAQSDPNSSDYTNWQNANNVLFPIGEAVDVCHPSLYTFYDDQAGWVRFAKAMIAECRRIAPGKPVIPVIWPQYHPSNSSLRYQYVSPTYWRAQLEVLREHADGISIWGGWHSGALQWDSSAPWWHETLDFIADGFGDPLPTPDPEPDPEPDPDPDPDPTPDPDPAPTPRLDALETAIDEINQRLDEIDAALQKGKKARRSAGEALSQ
jgi:hypothetical protein